MGKEGVKEMLFGDSPTLAARENALVPVYVVDAEARCVYVNPRYCELYEISREQALALGWLDRVHPEDRERVIAAKRRWLTTTGSLHIDYRIITTRGVTLPLASTSTPVLDDQGKFAGRTGIVTQTNPRRRPGEE
jgi:PAS domain S-box-containing protein